MSDDTTVRYRKALGARILSEANDLKRTREALAAELGIPQATVDAVIAGDAAVEQAHDLMRAMAGAYPISLADLWLEPDDTDDGVVIMRAEASQATSRVFDRKDRDGALTPYYEYRDTAMSRAGPFKPEWIQEIRVVQDADPENPDVAYNNGHLMHQQTFFIGDVNFYWSIEGEKHCAEMNTGDSNYITPFVPHSFTSRNPDKLGLIVAITFAGQVRRALNDFARIDGAIADEMSGDLRTPDSAYRARLGRQLAAESMAPAELAARLASAGVEVGRADDLAAGAMPASADETAVVAGTLNVRPADLMVSGLEAGGEVVLRFARDGGARPWPDGNAFDCRITELARTRHQPGLKGFAVDVSGDSEDAAPFRHGLYEYVYNYGGEPVLLRWADDREDALGPGDSACIRPMIAHRFARPGGAGEGRLCVARVPGALGDPAIDEYATFAGDGRRRVSSETKQWF